MERSPLIRAAEAGDLPALARLLDDTAAGGPDRPGSGGLTALMRAAARGNAAAVDLLLARGAAVDALDAFANTALMYACARGHVGVAQLLLAAGAARGHANKYGLTAVEWSKWSKDAEAIGTLLAA
ncbi:MAG: ankyrin repeat domain-containing protein [Proteobacteria bacterium]|nr:ankyrin repeat domain-containing protein [Pseudomonadota bacterium]